MPEDKINDLKLDVELLKKDVEQFDTLCDRITQSIEKIQDVNQNLIKMISLHEQRHDQHEKTEEDLDDDIKELHSRITTINREIHDRIDQVEHHITERIDALRSDLIKHKQDDKNPFVKWADVDKAKYFFIAGILVAGFLLGKFDFFTLFSAIK